MVRFIFVIVIILQLIISLSNAQVKGFSPVDSDKFLQDEYTSKLSEAGMPQTDNIPLGDIIVPEFYFVGPGDILAIQNLTTSISNQYVVVSPENTVLMPRIGEIDLKGKTLAESRAAIIEAIKRINTRALVSVTLLKPRNVIVTLKGNVDLPGSFAIPASYRVSTAISMLSKLKPDQIPYNLSNNLSEKYISDDYKRQVMAGAEAVEIVEYSKRNILVLHNDGSSQIADVEAAAITGDIELDPYVRENDIISIPMNPKNIQEVSIAGAVLRPVRMPYKSGDNIGMLLKFGYGLRDDADLNNIILVNGNGSVEKLSLNAQFEAVNASTTITPGTTIIVGEKTIKNVSTGIVSVQGHVKNPGSYVLDESSSTLYDVIDAAGGFTDEAYLPLAYILRNDRNYINRSLPKWDISENFQYSDLKLEDTVRFKLDLSYKKPLVSSNFVKAFIDSNDRYNITLLDGDVVVVPGNPGTVYVYGQVNEPGYVLYQPNKNLKWYVEQAGGYAINAEEERARIISGRNKVWYEGDDDVWVNAGDEIYVPKPPDYPPGIELQTYAVIASAAASLIALLNIILLIAQ